MTILDRYILKKYFINLILWFFCIIGIYIVFDLFTNLEPLLEAAKIAGKKEKTIFFYYLFKSVPVAMMLCPLLGLISAMVTIAMLIHHNELIPIQAAGIPTLRIIAPLVVVAVLLAGTAAVVRETVLPHYLDELVMTIGQVGKNKGTIVNATIDNVTGIAIQGEFLFRKEQYLTEPNFVLHKPLVRQHAYLKAAKAFHYPANGKHPAGFMLTGLKEENEVTKGETLKLNNKDIIITNRTAPDFVEKGNCFVVTDVPFDYLGADDAWRQYASTWELLKAVRNKSLDVGDRVASVIHIRLLQPFLDITLLFLGLPLIVASGDRNVFKVMGISALVVFAFLAVCQGCQWLGSSAEMPVLGAWLPLIIFLPMAVNQMLKLREK
ncbi:MAG: LptF/LptG family permease [Planctomycetaceae bacterium]|nr:LptF/LptG family permease [Planctomycetaceae bacterium]